MTSEAGAIYLFTDGSCKIQSSLLKVLRLKGFDTYVAKFLNQVHDELQSEYRNLTYKEQSDLHYFNSLEDLAQQSLDNAYCHPAIQSSTTVLVQLACFITSVERNPNAIWPRLNEDLFLSFCIGELSAAAISLATDITSLIPIAVETVKIAFKIGLLASRTGEDIEPRKIPARSWSSTIQRRDDLSNNRLLKIICDKIGLIGRHTIYITYIDSTKITFGGPPSSLEKFFSYLEKEDNNFSQERRCDINIYAPYHSPYLYSVYDITKLLSDVFPAKEDIVDQTRYVSSSKPKGSNSMDIYNSQHKREVFEKILSRILIKPIDWSGTIDESVTFITKSQILRWFVRPVGYIDNSRKLSSELALRTDKSIELDFKFVFDTLSTTSVNPPLAIVGFSGRFPHCDSVDEFWDLLLQGRECHAELPKTRFSASDFGNRPVFGCFLKKPSLFDAKFFNLSPREARQTDPGQRLALLTAYEALEMSGFVPNRTPSSRSERIGTFFGQTTDEYKDEMLPEDIGPHFVPGTIRAFGPGRINHFFKFGGPAISLDTACSSSFTALQTACSSIWSGECDTAIVGGVNLLYSSKNFNGLYTSHFLSPTGGCKSFDINADGYCRGEAVACVILKPLTAASADHDKIFGTIKSVSSTYSYGASSITYPWAPAQEKLHQKVLQDAGIDPLDISFIEMHGTGTQAGDTVEMSSVIRSFATPPRALENPLFLGAVKANIGHGESASGITSLIKSILVLQEKLVPPHIGVKNKLNEKLGDLTYRNIHLDQSVASLPATGGMRTEHYALVNNFSAAGGNTACILAEAPTRTVRQKPVNRTLYPVAVSAQSENSLRHNLQRLYDYVYHHPNVSLSDLSYTTTARRNHYQYRMISVCANVDTLLADLKLKCLSHTITRSSRSPKLVMVFPGQGSFCIRSAKILFDTCKNFRTNMLNFQRIAKSHKFPDFLSSFLATSHSESDFGSIVKHQLCMISVQIALYELMISLGGKPKLVIGHSFGEYTAMYASGVLSASEVIYLVGRRANLLQKHCTQGKHKMLAVRASLSTVYQILGTTALSVEVACLNSPQEVVLSGPKDRISEVSRTLQSQGVNCKVLDIPFAYHSTQMDAILKPLEAETKSLQFRAPVIPLASTLLGKIVRDESDFDNTYIRRHVRSTVDFLGALELCQQAGYTDEYSTWVEISTHSTFCSMLKSFFQSPASVLPTLRRQDNPWASLCQALSALYMKGVDIDWHSYNQDIEPNLEVLKLPAYAWDLKDYHLSRFDNLPMQVSSSHGKSLPDTSDKTTMITTTVHQLLSSRKVDKATICTFKSDFSNPNLSSLVKGHIVGGVCLCPASVYADMALTAAAFTRTISNSSAYLGGLVVKRLKILHPIIVSETYSQAQPLLEINTTSEDETDGSAIRFRIQSPGESHGKLIAECSIESYKFTSKKEDLSSTNDLVMARIRQLEHDVYEDFVSVYERDNIYRLFSSLVAYDSRFRGMEKVFIDTTKLEAFATLNLGTASNHEIFFYNPYWIDSFAQLSGFVLNTNKRLLDQKWAFIFSGWDRFELPQDVDSSKKYQVYVKMRHLNASVYTGTLYVLCEEIIVGHLENVEFRKVPQMSLSMLLRPADPIVTTPTLASLAPLKSEIPKMAMPSQQEDFSQSTELSQTSIVYTPKSSATPFPDATPLFDDVLAVISEETGITSHDLKDECVLTSLGIDSLLSLSIGNRVSTLLSPDFSYAAFNKCLTIGDLRLLMSNAHSIQNKSELTSNDTKKESLSSAVASVTRPCLLQPKNTEEHRSHAIDTLYSAIADCTGITVSELSGLNDFQTLGIDSILKLTIISEIRRISGIILQPIDLVNVETLSELKEIYLDGLQRTTPYKTNDIQATQYSSQADRFLRRKSDFERCGRAPTSNDLSYILNGGCLSSTQRILFLFPDGSGSAASYTPLVNPQSQFCLVSLNSPFLHCEASSKFTVSSIVAQWLPEIRRRQPNGPYNFGGWSAGGYYAYEATRAMLAAGEEVHRLILIDSPSRNVYEPFQSELLHAIDKRGLLGTSKTPSAKRAPQWLLNHFQATIQAVSKYQPAPLDQSQVEELRVLTIWAKEGVSEEMYDANAKEWYLRTRIAQFLLQDRYDFEPSGWMQLLPHARVTSKAIPGTHFSILQEPKCQELIALLESAIREHN